MWNEVHDWREWSYDKYLWQDNFEEGVGTSNWLSKGFGESKLTKNFK
jgi:hypothetical protein